MKFKVISLLAFVLILISSILPFKFYIFEYKKLETLEKEKNTYDKALFDVLIKDLKIEADKNQCKNYILPVLEVKGNMAQDYPNLKTDLNLVLKTYDNWKLRVDENTQNEMNKRIDEKIAVWGDMGITSEMQELLEKHKTTTFKTEYSAKAECIDIDNIEAGKVKVILFINDDSSGSNIFQISATFLKNSILNSLLKSKKNAHISLSILFFVLTIYLIYLIIFIVLSSKKKKQDQAYANFLISEIQKREDLIKSGHFVLALELCDKYLKVFSEDTDIKAFRQRILDFTNNDPEKAQLAFVENKKLNMRLQSGNLILDKEEKEKLQALLPFNESLAKSFKEYEAKSFMMIEHKNNEAEAILSEVKEDLKNGEIQKAKDKLLSIKNYDKANNVLKSFNHLNKNSFILKPENPINKELYLYFKNEIILGRTDEDFKIDIDLEDKRVSRNHLKITSDGNEIFAEDLSSTTGTYLNGEKIQKVKLKNNDSLVIAKIIDCKVSFEKNNKINAFVLKIKNQNHIVILQEAKIEFKDFNLCLKSGESNFIFKDNYLIFIDENEFYILNQGSKININSNNYELT